MLPRRGQDDETGERRTAGYLALLAGQTSGALSFMVREACKRFIWFPTAKELLDILAEYRPPQPEQALALIECERFADQAFARWIANIADGQPVGDVPEQWMRIAVERGQMRRLEDGTFVSRALYQGPVKAYVPPVREATPYIHVSPPPAVPVEQAQAKAA